MTVAGSEPAGAAAPETLLIVDSEVIVRVALAAYLRDCGYTVIEASDAAEAQAVLGWGATEIDVVLSEVSLDGDLDGFGLSRWIRVHHSGVEVILVATPARAAEAAGTLCEQGPLLTKPYDHQLVLARIHQLLAGRKP